MKFDFFDRRSAERFAELLDETNGGPRRHSRVPADDQFAELVAIGHGLSAPRSPGVQVDTEFRVGLRAMLVATAERDGIGATAADLDPEPGAHAGAREPGRGLLRTGSARRIRVRGAIVISVAAGAMAVSGISAASENASPGDALYGVKRSTERAQLAMAGNNVTRGGLSLDFARTRLAEAAAMDGDDTSFGAVLNDMDNDTRQGVRLLTSSAVLRSDTAPLTTVDSFVTSQRRTLQPILSRLDNGNRQRAQASVSLLDTVRQRAADLRISLACKTVDSDGVDALGPKLTSCIAGKELSTPDRPEGTAERQSTKTTGSSQGGTEKAVPERAVPIATLGPVKAPPPVQGPTVAVVGAEPSTSPQPEQSTAASDRHGTWGGSYRD